MMFIRQLYINDNQPKEGFYEIVDDTENLNEVYM